MKGKKGFIFTVLLDIGLILVLSLLLLTLAGRNALWGKGPNEKIGSRQQELFDLYVDGEKALLYLDTVAKYAAVETFQELGKQGGLQTAHCGEVSSGQIPWWYAKDGKECIPTPQEYRENFGKIFTKKLHAYLEQYEEEAFKNPYKDFKVDDFVISFDTDKRILGTAKKKLTWKDTYELVPSFAVALPLSISWVDFLGTLGKDMIATCQDKKTIALDTCLEKLEQSYSNKQQWLTIEILPEDKSDLLSLPRTAEVKATLKNYDKNVWYDQPIEFRFAIEIPKRRP